MKKIGVADFFYRFKHACRKDTKETDIVIDVYDPY